MGDGIDPVPGLNVFLGDRGRADAVNAAEGTELMVASAHQPGPFQLQNK